MKKIILLPLLFACGSAQAVPNIWEVGFAQGILEYYISDSQERFIRITCVDEIRYNYDHGAELIIKNKTYENTDSKYPLTFLLDGKRSVTPPASTGWRGGTESWNDFVDGMSEAKKIDVYLNNKKVTTFTPIKESINEVASYIADCRGQLS